MERDIAIPEIRYRVIDGFNALWRFNLENLIKSDNTVATDQIIRYPPVSDDSRYTFSLWAFPEENYGKVLPQYLRILHASITTTTGYRINMLYVGYRIAQGSELAALLFVGRRCDDDRSRYRPRIPGWTTFLDAYNQFCSDHGGIPLLNQTPRLTRAQVQKALGERLKQFAAARKKYDPERAPAERLFPRHAGRRRRPPLQ